MAVIHLTEASSGAPVMSGTNGALAAIMDWALVQNGWSIDFTTGNARVYRPGSGNRFSLHLNDDSATSGDARLCVVRGCESASGATTLVDPFPLASQVANGSANWLKSTTAAATARNYDIYVAPTFVIVLINPNSVTNNWDWYFFGDLSPALSGDTYATLCTVRNSATVSASVTATGLSSAFLFNSRMYFTRSYDGTVKSSMGAIYTFNTSGGSGQNWGAVGTGAPAALAGATTGLDFSKAYAFDAGSQTTVAATGKSLPRRAWVPNMLNPLHNGPGTINTRDTFTDTAYDASFVGRCFCPTTISMLVIQESGTWVPPSG